MVPEKNGFDRDDDHDDRGGGLMRSGRKIRGTCRATRRLLQEAKLVVGRWRTMAGSLRLWWRLSLVSLSATFSLAGSPVWFQVVHESGKERTFFQEEKGSLTIMEWVEPPVETTAYALSFEIDTDWASGDGYVELNHDFGEQGVFFTKTLAPQGAMSLLGGSLKGRQVVLPFFRNENGTFSEASLGLPQRLILKVHAPEQAKWVIRDLSLVPLSDQNMLDRLLYGEAMDQARARVLVIFSLSLALLFTVLALLAFQWRRKRPAGPSSARPKRHQP
jgi:hypothetical protein